jgi:SAM-dependent methyltransferase
MTVRLRDRGDAFVGRALLHVRSPTKLPALIWKNLRYPFTAAARERRRDRRLGIDTVGYVAREELDPITSLAALTSHYEPTPGPIAEHLIRQVAGQASQFTFVDFGAGKGRVTLMAAMYPFARVIAIEHSPRLAATARANAERLVQRNKIVRPIEVILADATQWCLPPEPCVLFFFHPFDASLLRQVAHQIIESHQRTPRKIFLVFYNTEPYEDVFAEFFSPSIFRRTNVTDLPRDRTVTRTDLAAAIFESMPW